MGVRSSEMASSSNPWENSMNNLITRAYGSEQPWMRGLLELEDPVLPRARLSWTCPETTRLRGSFTLAMPSTVTSKSLGVSPTST